VGNAIVADVTLEAIVRQIDAVASRRGTASTRPGVRMAGAAVTGVAARLDVLELGARMKHRVLLTLEVEADSPGEAAEIAGSSRLHAAARVVGSQVIGGGPRDLVAGGALVGDLERRVEALEKRMDFHSNTLSVRRGPTLAIPRPHRLKKPGSPADRSRHPGVLQSPRSSKIPPMVPAVSGALGGVMGDGGRFLAAWRRRRQKGQFCFRTMMVFMVSSKYGARAPMPDPGARHMCSGAEAQ